MADLKKPDEFTRHYFNVGPAHQTTYQDCSDDDPKSGLWWNIRRIFSSCFEMASHISRYLPLSSRLLMCDVDFQMCAIRIIYLSGSSFLTRVLHAMYYPSTERERFTVREPHSAGFQRRGRFFRAAEMFHRQALLARYTERVMLVYGALETLQGKKPWKQK